MVVRQAGNLGKVEPDKTTLARTQLCFYLNSLIEAWTSKETMSLLVLRFIASRDAKHPWCLSAVFSFALFLLVLRAVGQSGESLSLMETLPNILGLRFAAMSFSK